MMSLSYFLLLAWTWSSAEALTTQAGANPIRKIVTLLQDMQKEIAAEGEKEEDAFNKFMCYCDGNVESMKASAADGAQLSTELKAKLEASKSQKSQLDQELKEHGETRANAKQELTKGTSIREKEHADFEADAADMRNNIAASGRAIDALEKGAGAFMQMGASQLGQIRRMVDATSAIDDFEKQTLLDFMQGKQGQDYAPQSGQITGMLKAMKDEMEKDLADATAAEEAAVKGFAELSAAKQSEIQSSTDAIESKTKRSGELAVEIVQTADAIEDTDKEVAETQGFLADLDTQCASKKSEWDERQKMRAEETAAIGQAIGILNDDDALDLFKKTASSFSQTSTGLGFLQQAAKTSKVSRAEHLVLSLAQTSRTHQTQLSLIASALKSKAVDMSKLVEMIDGMVGVLKEEQASDESHKSFCEGEFAKSAQEKTDAEDHLSSLSANLEEMSSTVATLTEEIAALQKDIKTLDKAVAEATELRKSDHANFVTTQAENSAAVQLVEKAKNKLFQFYRPEQYQAPPEKELTAEEKILAASGRSDLIATAAPEMIPGTTQTVYAQVRVANDAAPPAPPETFGAYQKKDGKSNGVIALMDMMINDLKTDSTEAEHAEDTAQREYERLMSESQKTREQNAKSITEKESTKAEWGSKIEDAKEEQATTTQSLQEISQYITKLHGDCDFLISNFDMRKEARTNEIEGLGKAKAVLSGANFS